MAELTSTAEIARQIVDGSIHPHWLFYLVWVVLSAVGAALGVWIKERFRGDVTKEIWLAQESWKEKYRLYTLLISATEEIAGALWNILTDTQKMAQMHNSTEQGGRSYFPEHKKWLDIENRANERLLSAEVGVKLMLNKAANEALEKIKATNTMTSAAINMTYWQRINERCMAASEAKVKLIEAAKDDLKI